MAKKKKKSIIPTERIEKSIILIRDERVMLVSNLADLYAVTTGQLNQAVRRNGDRFPDDFAFQLTRKEFTHLKSQSVTSSWVVDERPLGHSWSKAETNGISRFSRLEFPRMRRVSDSAASSGGSP